MTGPVFPHATSLWQALAQTGPYRLGGVLLVVLVHLLFAANAWNLWRLFTQGARTARGLALAGRPAVADLLAVWGHVRLRFLWWPRALWASGLGIWALTATVLVLEALRLGADVWQAIATARVPPPLQSAFQQFLTRALILGQVGALLGLLCILLGLAFSLAVSGAWNRQTQRLFEELAASPTSGALPK